MTETLSHRFARFARSSLVGLVATIVDFAILELLARGLHMAPIPSKAIALACGVTTQFVGSRYYAFRAHAGSWHRQLRAFLIVEACAYCLSLGVFEGLRTVGARLHIPVDLELANLLTGSIVYFGFSYPIWKRVFHVDPNTLEAEDEAVAEGTAGASTP